MISPGVKNEIVCTSRNLIKDTIIDMVYLRIWLALLINQIGVFVHWKQCECDLLSQIKFHLFSSHLFLYCGKKLVQNLSIWNIHKCQSNNAWFCLWKLFSKCDVAKAEIYSLKTYSKNKVLTKLTEILQGWLKNWWW